MNNLKFHTLILLCVLFISCARLNNVREQRETSTELLKLEKKVHQLVNRYRVAQNRPPLITHEVITQQARKHSQSMANNEAPLGHDRFEKRKEIISRVLSFVATAENVASVQGYSDCAQSVVKIWLEGITHKENIEGNYTLTGIGIAKDAQGTYYFTQIFWQ